jgi:hypothetical protein
VLIKADDFEPVGEGPTLRIRAGSPVFAIVGLDDKADAVAVTPMMIDEASRVDWAGKSIETTMTAVSGCGYVAVRHEN